MSPEFLKEKQFRVPGRGFLASIIALLACAGAVGAWFFVSFEWRVGCGGDGNRLSPAASSRQAFRCEDLGQRDARIFFAALGLVGLIMVVLAVRMWAFGKLTSAVVVFAVVLPVALPYVGYLVVTRPSDNCDQLSRANLKASITTWKGNDKKGPKPNFCERI